jgi:predicted amidohydrolase
MTTLNIAAAQSVSVPGNIAANIASHLDFMDLAADHGVNFLVFPELSLTGYEQSLARELAIAADDAVLDPLRDRARSRRLTAVVGMPLTGPCGMGGSHGVFIAALVLFPDGTVGVHTKKHLHPGEDAVFMAGQGGPLLSIPGADIALAICADYTHATHAASAARDGANLYAAAALVTENGYAPESEMMAGYAATHGMAVLLANHGGPSGGWNAVGRSAIWAAGGRQIAVAPGRGEVLVIAQRGSDLKQGGPDAWSGRIVPR